MFDDGKCNSTELLKLILKKVDCIEDHLIKLDVKINFLGSRPSNAKKVIKSGIVDMNQLKQFELPTESEVGLENLDKKLKKEMEFKEKLVSKISI